MKNPFRENTYAYFAVKNYKVALNIHNSRDPDLFDNILEDASLFCEKILKQIIDANEKSVSSTHNIRQLYRDAVVFEPRLQDIKNSLLYFQGFFHEVRYPMPDYKAPSKVDIDEAIESITAIYNYIIPILMENKNIISTNIAEEKEINLSNRFQ